MSFPPRFIIDSATKTSRLELFVSGVFVTAYSYNLGNVTLSERPNSENVSLLNLKENLGQIREWLNLIHQLLEPPFHPRSPFYIEISKSEESLQAEYQNDEITVSKVEYQYPNQSVEFLPRAEILMNFHDFEAWVHFLFEVYDDIVRFA